MIYSWKDKSQHKPERTACGILPQAKIFSLTQERVYFPAKMCSVTLFFFNWQAIKLWKNKQKKKKKNALCDHAGGFAAFIIETKMQS